MSDRPDNASGLTKGQVSISLAVCQNCGGRCFDVKMSGESTLQYEITLRRFMLLTYEPCYVNENFTSISIHTLKTNI